MFNYFALLTVLIFANFNAFAGFFIGVSGNYGGNKTEIEGRIFETDASAKFENKPLQMGLHAGYEIEISQALSFTFEGFYDFAKQNNNISNLDYETLKLENLSVSGSSKFGLQTRLILKTQVLDFYTIGGFGLSNVQALGVALFRQDIADEFEMTQISGKYLVIGKLGLGAEKRFFNNHFAIFTEFNYYFSTSKKNWKMESSVINGMLFPEMQNVLNFNLRENSKVAKAGIRIYF